MNELTLAITTIGDLLLNNKITRENSGSSWNPKAKIEHYSDNRINAISVASIKFRIMMQKCKDNANKDVENGMEWIYNDMKEHQENMLNIIFLSETDS